VSTITTKDGTQMALKPHTKKAMNTPNYTPAVTAKCVTYKTLSVIVRHIEDALKSEGRQGHFSFKEAGTIA